MCSTVIKNICCISAALYIQLVQQKVPASQYVLLRFGLKYYDERIHGQQCLLSLSFCFEFGGSCCKGYILNLEKKITILSSNYLYAVSSVGKSPYQAW